MELPGYSGFSLLTEPERLAILETIPPRGRVLEVGTFCGASAAWLAGQRPEAIFWCLDDFSWPGDSPGGLLPYDHWMANRRANMRLVAGNSRSLAAIATPRSFDVALVDADHNEDPCLVDLRAVEPLVREGGWLLAHDFCDDFPGVQAAVIKFAASSPWKIVRTVDSLAMLYRT